MENAGKPLAKGRRAESGRFKPEQVKMTNDEIRMTKECVNDELKIYPGKSERKSTEANEES